MEGGKGEQKKGVGGREGKKRGVLWRSVNKWHPCTAAKVSLSSTLLKNFCRHNPVPQGSFPFLKHWLGSPAFRILLVAHQRSGLLTVQPQVMGDGPQPIQNGSLASWHAEGGAQNPGVGSGYHETSARHCWRHPPWRLLRGAIYSMFLQG